ncbi:MAG: hypothetical protein ACLFWR_13825 [Acidimicrobiales bacterium]
MPKFTVARDYRANHNGHFFAYKKGSQVEEDQAHADWVNRDSPGTLVPVGARKKAARDDTASQDGDA